MEEYLVAQAVDRVGSQEWGDGHALAEEAVHRIWDRLHMGKWNDVDPKWRQLFATACDLLAQCQLHEKDTPRWRQIKAAIHTLDTGLLMAGPYGRQLHATMDALVDELAALPECDAGDAHAASPRPRKRTCVRLDQIPPPLPDTTNPLCTRLKRIHAPAMHTFLDEYMRGNKPVIITGGLDHWPALGKTDNGQRCWADLDYLGRVAGARTVPVEIGSSYLEDNWSQTLMTLREFIDEHIVLGQASAAPGYLAQHALFEQIPQLRRDIVVPDYCALSLRDDDDDDEMADVVLNAWFGPAHTVSPLHFDPKHNLLCQVVGSKYIRLYEAAYSARMYPVDGLLSNTSQVVVDDVDEAAFPAFMTAPYWECVLAPGEMLYIPPQCWHYIKSLQVSFSVSCWWD
ncbi:Aste57867_7944 [Aphanomyces stellatus]|uniref:Aste57867_7944 protein n=1 Tax=Aphanomyces stellatus TaxID=120398 RepID=A0A485KJ08_9STRA|nr:hypothetical protein As57867_007914 [Aphanomyces stellatus]VFT84837.1 Aste57867_7944 [Aphanomyces stellatus]